MKRSIRSLAWLAIAVQPAFVAAWIVASALQHGYSATDSGVSALAAQGARDPWIVMVALLAMGLSLAALASGLRAVLPRGATSIAVALFPRLRSVLPRRAASVAIALFLIAGAAFVVCGLSRLDCDVSQTACNARLDDGVLSWHTTVHLWAALVAGLALLLTPFALSRALWPSPTAVLALSAGCTGVVIGGAGALLTGLGGADGIVQRVELGAVNLWVVIVAAGILFETRSAPPLSAPAALRPRDFFGSAWAGDGMVLGVPGILWRRFAPRFTLTRETTWHSEEVGVVRDRAVLADGSVEERLRYARFVDPSHIHISADDMPDGAEVTIDERGYRIAPYRVLVPVGPLRFMLKARDEATVERDGTLFYTVRLRWYGLPGARLEMRARPVDTTSPAPEASGERTLA